MSPVDSRNFCGLLILNYQRKKKFCFQPDLIGGPCLLARKSSRRRHGGDLRPGGFRGNHDGRKSCSSTQEDFIASGPFLGNITSIIKSSVNKTGLYRQKNAVIRLLLVLKYSNSIVFFKKIHFQCLISRPF